MDLFCGAGGITEGLRQAGFRCIFANDIDPDSVETFRRNHPGVETVRKSIENLDPSSVRSSLGVARGELDCLVGGPPCQGFSINAPDRVLEDPRNHLFVHYLRFVQEFNPKTLLFENVPGMLSLAHGLVVKEVEKRLVDLGYEVSKRILFAPHYGVPQERWRLIILASRVGSAPQHPEPTHRADGRANFTSGRALTYRADELAGLSLRPFVTVADAIGDLPALRAGEGAEEMQYAGPPTSSYSRRMRGATALLTHHVAPRIAPINLERLQHIPPGGSWRDIPHHLLPVGMQRARRSDHTRRYGRLSAGGLSGTVMTKMDPHWGPAFHYTQDRTLTVREATRLQSFPDAYTFAGSRVSQYRQVGNAVPVLLAKAIGTTILDSLGSPGCITVRASSRAVQFPLCQQLVRVVT